MGVYGRFYVTTTAVDGVLTSTAAVVTTVPIVVISVVDGVKCTVEYIQGSP